MSDFVRLSSERKSALLKGDEKRASEIWEEMKKLKESRSVTEKEFKAAAYL